MFCDDQIMTLEGDELRELLAGEGLTAAEEIQPPSDEGVVWLLHAGAEDWFDAWQLLRDLVPQTGRWPLAVTDVATGWNQPPPPGRRDLRPGRVMRRLATVDVPALLDALERDADPEPLGDWLDFHLEDTEELCGHAPTAEEVRSALGETTTEMAVERWLLAWERRHCPGSGEGGPAPYLNWFDPGGEIKLLLLPRPEPWSAAVYVGHFGGDWPDSDLRPALVRHWSELYGAEPVANWDTMQQFVVRRPPGTLDQAWEVARAQALLWYDTVALPGQSVRQFARDLVGRERWFLHLRP